MARQSKDLFDDSTMTFGEHLEVLRYHLFMSIIGLVIAVIVCLIYGTQIVSFVRQPIDAALKNYGVEATDDIGQPKEGTWWEYIKDQFDLSVIWGGGDKEPDDARAPAGETAAATMADPTALTVQLNVRDLAAALNALDPDHFPLPEEGAPTVDKQVSLTLHALEFAQFRRTTEQLLQPVTLNVQEAFMTYLKVSMIAGLVLASPWIFFQLWQFVAAGLYPHERKFVYAYGGISLFLFVAGAAFCFFLVFPFVLKFLLSFNFDIGVTPQIRLSEWISFAVLLPLMFGISFQLPLVMRFLTAISIFDADDYRQKRRLAILVIAAISMVLTPADPMSMLMMLVPLVGLYELGILLCEFKPAQSPFEAESA